MSPASRWTKTPILNFQLHLRRADQFSHLVQLPQPNATTILCFSTAVIHEDSGAHNLCASDNTVSIFLECCAMGNAHTFRGGLGDKYVHGHFIPMVLSRGRETIIAIVGEKRLIPTFQYSVSAEYLSTRPRGPPSGSSECLLPYAPPRKI